MESTCGEKKFNLTLWEQDNVAKFCLGYVGRYVKKLD